MTKPPRQAPPSVAPMAQPCEPPAHALSIWLDASGQVRAAINSPSGRAGHSIAFATADAEHFGAALLKLLTARAATRHAPRIGERAAPTQALLDAYAAALGAAKPIKRAEMREEHLSDSDFLDEA